MRTREAPFTRRGRRCLLVGVPSTRLPKNTVLGLTTQTPQAKQPEGVWLSQIVRGMGQGRYDGVPPSDMVNFPAIVKTLSDEHILEILENQPRQFTQNGNSATFSYDIRFRVVAAPSAKATPGKSKTTC